jgi:hypothetical protein
VSFDKAPRINLQHLLHYDRQRSILPERFTGVFPFGGQLKNCFSYWENRFVDTLSLSALQNAEDGGEVMGN